MKRFLIYSIALAAFSLPAASDVVPPDSHNFVRCVRIANLEEFPEFRVVAVTIAPGGETKAFAVRSSDCLDRGYKFNRFKLYWTTAKHFAEADLSKLMKKKNGWLPDHSYRPIVDYTDDPEFHEITETAEPEVGHRPNTESKSYEEYVYMIQRTGDGIKLVEASHRVL